MGSNLGLSLFLPYVDAGVVSFIRLCCVEVMQWGKKKLHRQENLAIFSSTKRRMAHGYGELWGRS